MVYVVGVVVYCPFLFVVCQDEDATCGVLGFGAAVDADAGALGDMLHDGEQSFELRGLGHGDVIAERQDLIAFALEGIAEECAVDDETAGDGMALRLVTDELKVHKILVLIF